MFGEYPLKYMICPFSCLATGTIPRQLMQYNDLINIIDYKDAPDRGPDGAGLSCPGSSVLADEVRVEKVQLKFDWSGEG